MKRELRERGNILLLKGEKWRKIIGFLTLAITVMVFTSCDHWLDHKTDYYYRKAGVVVKEESDVSFILDRGTILLPESSRIQLSTLNDKDRIIVEFLIDSQVSSKPPTYEVEVYDVYNILTKDILPFSEEISDSLGYDPVRINDAWIKNGYITLDFTFLGGSPELKHMVNMVKYEDAPEGIDYLLEFRHNAFKDSYAYKQRGIVSFPVDGIDSAVIVGENVVYKVQVKYYGLNGAEKSFNIEWIVSGVDNEDEKIISYDALNLNDMIE